jgi:hypothetical protein
MRIFKKIIKKSFYKEQSGASLLLSILLVSAVLAATIGITSSIIILLQISGRVAESVAALYAADSGVEWQLYEIRISTTSAPVMANGATYNAVFTPGAPNIIKSVGVFKRTSRGIEASFD